MVHFFNKLSDEKDQIGIDHELSLYELTDLFYSFYRYHNDNHLIEYDHYYYNQGDTHTKRCKLSRFDILRKIEASKLGKRPFSMLDDISEHRPNVSLGHMKLYLTYLTLPYKAVLSNKQFSKIKIDRNLYEINNLSDKELEDLRLNKANSPLFFSNAEISDDVSDAFNEVMSTSKDINKCHDIIPSKLPQDGIIAILHSDSDYKIECIEALDLVTEPQAQWDSSTWSSFFIIRKITANEVVAHIRESTPFWDTEALRWALENSAEGRSLLNSGHYNGSRTINKSTDESCGENFYVKSFYSDKGVRESNLGGYYGNLLVVEGYYINTSGKVNKVIFFPSSDFNNIQIGERDKRNRLSVKEQKELGIFGADVLFFRSNVYNTLDEAFTVIPFDRSEKTLERQRGSAHEIFSPIELLSRLESNLMNIANIMSVPGYKNAAEGTNAQEPEDLEIDAGGEMINFGQIELIPSPIQADLNALLLMRQTLIQHIAAKSFLGGLDGNEMTKTGRGAELSNLRLVRDGRVYKNQVEDFAEGLKEMYSKILMSVLKGKDKRDVIKDKLLETKFFNKIIRVQGHPEEILEFEKEDILEDTKLPYWMDVEAIRNGASHFGAAEIVVFREIMQTFGSGLDQQAIQAINRMGIKSLVGSSDAIDILGDPKDRLVTNVDQVHQATIESGAIFGSVDSGGLTFKPIPVRPAKDDHVVHLTEVHMRDAEQLLQRIQGTENPSQSLDDMTEEQLETRNSLILKLGATANHISLHAEQLERFGSNRDDINQLKEQVNIVLQQAEGLMGSLERNLRALEQKRAEKEARLQNISPENEAEKMKQQVELEKISVSREKNKMQLAVAQKIAQDRQQQHIDKQVSKARDRAQRERESIRKADVELQKTVIQQENTPTNFDQGE